MANYPSFPLAQLIEPNRSISYGIVQPGSATADGVPIIRVSDVRNGQISTTNPLRVRPDLEAQYQRTRLQGGELLLTIVGTIGETAIVPRKLAGWNVARAIAVLPVRSDVGAYWVQLALKSPLVRSQIDSRLNTTVQATLNLGDVAQLPILLPPQPERQNIGAVLSALDDKIELNRRMNETLEAMARTIFKDWFVDFGPTRTKMEGRAPYLAPEVWRLFPDRLGGDERPIGWRPVRVEDISERVAMGPFGSNIKVSTFVDDGIPVVSGQHLNSTMMEDSEFNFVTVEHADRLRSANVFRGDIVFTHAGNIGQVSYIPETSKYTRYVLSQRQFYLRCNKELVSPTYLIYFFRASEGQHKLLANTSSTGVPSISRPATNLKAIELCLPSKDLLDAFDALVLEFHRSIGANLSGNSVLASTRDLLLPKLMSGEIRVKDTERMVEGGTVSPVIAEGHVEEAALAWLAELGYVTASGIDIGPDGNESERANYRDVLLIERVRAAIAKLNPTLSHETWAEVLAKLTRTETPSLIEENRRLHRYMIEGVPVEVKRSDGSIGGEQARLIDFDDPEANDWLVVNQYTVIENKANRRPDVVIFVNGLPLGVIELKNPGDENATLDGAFNQLQTYKAQITSLFRTNAVLVISDGISARIGSLTAERERFMPWRTVTGDELAPKNTPELETILKGVFHQRRFLDLVKDFIVFGDTGSGLSKILAGYHQFHAVREAVARTLAATSPDGDRKVGVIWHTQGSGKSLLMAFYAGQIIKHPVMENPTLIVLTDRNDLDDQLFATFSMCKDLLRQTPQQAGDREELRKLLDRPAGGVIFTTLQKFSPEQGTTDYPVLTDRRNVIVIADEAHRSQYGFDAKVERKTGDISYGFAKYLRDGLPNASFIGFTGTPIEKEDVNTPAVFGNYIDIYDISRAVEDGATVPIYYESRLARIELDENEKPKIDAEIAELTEDEAQSEQERLKRKWASVEALVGAEKRLALIAEDLVKHFEARNAALDGKGMIVCMSRRICVALYDAIIKLRPAWRSDDDDKGAIKVVMTLAASDPPAWQAHIGTRPKARRELLAKRTKNPKDPLKLVIVRDMWLTGFDAPCMHTMYIDKPMKGHGLMQAIARVNRVFRDKPAGLVVDYIGVAQNLKAALGQYSSGDRAQTGIDEAQAIHVLLEKYEIVRAIFRPDTKGGFDYRPALDAKATPQSRLAIMAGAIDWVLTVQQADAAKETTAEGKKHAQRRYADGVVALSRAFALASASDEASVIRDEVGFFQAIRAALIKSVPSGGGKTAAERELAIQQIVSRAVVSTEIVDIMKAAGLESQDISILSDEFLAEVREMGTKNLAVEALRKLINGDVRSHAKSNFTQSKAFTERLEAAIARYHSNALTTAQVLEELIQLAKDIRAARARGEETGLTDEEIAFYDALAENESARQVMGEPALRVIAHELVTIIKGNVTVDWMHRESARANIRRHVKRLLRKYGYPPDLQDAAVQNVLQQAEALSAEWTAAV